MMTGHRRAIGPALCPIAAGHVRNGAPGNAVPSGREPVNMSCLLGLRAPDVITGTRDLRKRLAVPVCTLDADQVSGALSLEFEALRQVADHLQAIARNRGGTGATARGGGIVGRRRAVIEQVVHRRQRGQLEHRLEEFQGG